MFLLLRVLLIWNGRFYHVFHQKLEKEKSHVGSRERIEIVTRNQVCKIADDVHQHAA